MRCLALVAAVLILAGCGASSAEPGSRASFTVTPVASFDEPWAMTFLPDGRLLVTEKAGTLRIVDHDGKKSAPLEGVPKVAYGGFGGLGDVVLHPDFARNHLVYLSFAEGGDFGSAGAAMGRGTLGPRGIENFTVIWRQEPKIGGEGNYGYRMAFSPDGFLFITSAERQKDDPSQDMSGNLGKIVRLTDDGKPAPGNPFYPETPVKAQIWTLGHRNPLGIAFAPDGRLWETEMGPKGGDELNLIERGKNYGWPIVSEGDHYDDRPIPRHKTHPEFAAPKLSWTPVISPANLIFYTGDLFPKWKGSALIGGLSSEALVRVSFDGGKPREAERFAMGHRIREVEQGPDGAVWLLEDGPDGRLLKLTPIK